MNVARGRFVRWVAAALLATCAASPRMPATGLAQAQAASADRSDDLDALRASRRRMQAGLADLLASLDQRIRQLTDNDLTDLPPYADLAMARHRIDRLATEALPAIGESLEAAAAATRAARAARIDDARRRLDAVHHALLAEQYRFETRRAHAAMVDQLDALLAAMHALRDRLPELTGDDEQGALEAIEAHAAVIEQFESLFASLADHAARPDDLGAVAADAARRLARRDAAGTLDEAMRQLRQARFASAAERFDDAIDALRAAAQGLTQYGGAVAFDPLDARELDRISLRQQAILDAMPAAANDAAHARLLAEQTTVQLELRRLRQRPAADAATLARADHAAQLAADARRAMFRRDLPAAADLQRRALDAMRSLSRQLNDPTVMYAQSPSSHDWRKRADELAAAHARLRGLSSDSPGVADALRACADKPYLSPVAASRLQAALDSADALPHAVAAVGEAQRLAHRRALAVSIGERHRLAAALNVAAAAAHRLDPPPPRAEAAAMLDNLQRLVRRAVDLEPTALPLADAARLFDEPFDAAGARDRLHQVARMIDLAAETLRADLTAIAEQIDRDAAAELDDALRLEQRLTDLADADRLAAAVDRRLIEQAFEVAPAVGAALSQPAAAPRDALRQAAILAQVHRQDLESVRRHARLAADAARLQQQAAAALSAARLAPEPPDDDLPPRAFAEPLRNLGQSAAALAQQPLANHPPLIEVLHLADSFDPANAMGVRFIPRSPLAAARWIVGRPTPSGPPAVPLPLVVTSPQAWPDRPALDSPSPAPAVSAPPALLNALPPALRDAMRTIPRPDPPRGYEQRLRYYFQNLD